MSKRVIYFLVFAIATTLAFFDINNHLNIGPADQNNFYPTNHGIFGNTLKAVFVLVALLALIKLVDSFIKNKIIASIVIIVIVVAILSAANLLAFKLYFTF